ncbi:unnamed protein product, partial [Polarella glacialis]
AFLATLLNCIWLEPYAALLPKPPKEVLQLLTGLPPSVDGKTPSTKSGGPPKEVHPFFMGTSELMPGLGNGMEFPEVASGTGEAVAASSSLAKRSILVLLLLLFHEPQAHGIGRTFASLGGANAAHTALTIPVNLAKLRYVLLNKLKEAGYPFLLYCLVLKNEFFRQSCQATDEVIVPVLEVLSLVPAATDGKTLACVPASATSLLLTLLSLSGDSGFCDNASCARMADGRSVLGISRSVRDVALSSLMVAVLLRVALFPHYSG